MQEITYRIYSDESVSNGKYYSNFYGRSFSKSRWYPRNRKLNYRKSELNLNGEIKWSKVTGNYIDKYIEIIKLVFLMVLLL